MKMSAAKLKANRLNSLKSPGPTTITGKEIASRNAVRHAVLARKMVFKTSDEEAAFCCVHHGLLDYWMPVGMMEEILVEDIAINCWKLAVLTAWVVSEFQNPQDPVPTFILQKLGARTADSGSDTEFTGQGAKAAQIGWACNYVLMKVRTEEDDFDKGYGGDTNTKRQTTEFEARLEQSLNLAFRYEGGVRHHLHKDIRQLKELQNVRTGKEKNQTKPNE